MPPRDLANAILRRATRVTRLAEARADHERGPDALPAALLEHVDHCALRHDEHGQIGRLRQRLEARMAAMAVERLLARIDEVHGAGETATGQRAEEPARVRVRLRGADEDDRAGSEERGEVAIHVGHPFGSSRIVRRIAY